MQVCRPTYTRARGGISVEARCPNSDCYGAGSDFRAGCLNHCAYGGCLPSGAQVNPYAELNLISDGVLRERMAATWVRGAGWLG